MTGENQLSVGKLPGQYNANRQPFGCIVQNNVIPDFRALSPEGTSQDNDRVWRFQSVEDGSFETFLKRSSHPMRNRKDQREHNAHDGPERQYRRSPILYNRSDNPEGNQNTKY
jgi:hypothetical protein